MRLRGIFSVIPCYISHACVRYIIMCLILLGVGGRLFSVAASSSPKVLHIYSKTAK